MFSILAVAVIGCAGIFGGYLIAIATDRELRRRLREVTTSKGSRPMAEKLFQVEVNDTLIRNLAAFRCRLNHTVKCFVEETADFCAKEDLLITAANSFQLKLNDAVIHTSATFRFELDNMVRLYLERTISDNAQLPEHQDRAARLMGRDQAEVTGRSSIGRMPAGLGGSVASDDSLKRALGNPIGPDFTASSVVSNGSRAKNTNGRPAIGGAFTVTVKPPA